MLSILGKLYGVGMSTRNKLYDRGIFRSYGLGAKTISVGNITTGGTGKTPLVAYIANLLAENGEKVCILTRGFGRRNERERVLVSDGERVLVDAETSGDEPVELAGKLLGKAIVVADADRIRAARWAKEQFGITAFVLDDAFQHRRAKRDLDIVCIDATDPFGNGSILPSGKLRESAAGLARADAIVITRSDQAVNIDNIEDRITKANSVVPVFKCSNSITKFVALEEFHAKTQSSQSRSPMEGFAFSGLANNESFFKTLEAAGVRLLGRIGFADHHKYVQKDVEEIETLARIKQAECLITTAKDAVKLEGSEFSIPCFVAEIETVIDDPEGLRALVLSV